MLLASPHRLSWQLTCVLFATVSAATISSTNTSTARPNLHHGTLPLADAQGDGNAIADLIPLTQEATKSVKGNLYNTNYSSAARISNDEIAYISCNLNDYNGFDTPQAVFERAYIQANISAVILYSTASNYCNYSQDSAQNMIEEFAVYSMTNRDDSTEVLGAIIDLPAHMKYFVQVQGRDQGSDNAGSSNQYQQNPLGPSPSTAVAMTILYSITGIITALFLIIIITGAVRAHRHPERYGPRNVLGRPRQSRARGLGRAILDTIPIVKFGEKEPAKSADVELGSTAETGDENRVNVENKVSNSLTPTADHQNTTPNPIEGSTDTTRVATPTLSSEQQSGIAPAQSAFTGAVAGTEDASPDEGLGCSICTEDFEKGQNLRVLPCDHKFHPECVDPWLLNVSGTCPLWYATSTFNMATILTCNSRVDLRPVRSRDSSGSQDPNELAPPLNPEAESSHRRRTALFDILSLRHRPNASTEERIGALRRLREQRRNQSSDMTGGGADESLDDVVGAQDRENRGIGLRLSDVFTGRSRRERRDGSPAQEGGSNNRQANATFSVSEPRV
ncbi:hypothetical protein G6011_10306 [Alternaria panax]|uniref:RING-type domain-containing protein n=1 Tax=Alternaria panax TaxID=48097 RepID=A0AAD4NPQ8_9PLEO|nr:hypothetical protein G6011_10306 [Alternaria panax]